MPTPNAAISFWWLFLVAMFGYYSAVMWLIYATNRDVVAMLYAILSTCLLAIVSINVTVRATSHFDPVLLVGIQRGIYAPIVLSLAALVDIYLAEHNGHLSMLRRAMRWWERH